MALKGKKITSISNRKAKRNDSIRYCAEKDMHNNSVDIQQKR